MAETARYGTWSSPIEAQDVCYNLSDPADDVFVDPITGTIYHTEGRPSEGGRSAIMFTDTKREVMRKKWDARSRVHEYGGAPASAYDGIVYFSNVQDNRVYAVGRSEDPQPITPVNDCHRFAKLASHPSKPYLIIAILEDHTKPAPIEVVNSLCVINSRRQTVSTLVSGADFYSGPSFSPDGVHIAWEQWSNPDMSWEGGQIYVADVLVDDSGLKLSNTKHVGGVAGTISAAYPLWASNDVLIYTSDESGYQNPWKYTVSTGTAVPVLEEPVDVDFCLPRWYLGWEFSAPLDLEAGRVLYAAVRDGRSYLYVLSLEDGEAEEVECPYVNILVLKRVRDNVVVFKAESVDKPEAIVLCTLDEDLNPTFKELTGGFVLPISPSMISVAKSITLKNPAHDGPLHVLYYAPQNPNYRGLDGERPPCIVNAHGGPTIHASQGFKWEIQFFTSRGFAWLDVNYSGSSGFGREYIERLNGQWGAVDVQDCIHAMKSLSAAPHPLIDVRRSIIRGRAAGGYLALSASCKDRKAFVAATSMYGAADMQALVKGMHKFQLHHVQKLLGGSPQEIPDVYQERTPLHNIGNIGKVGFPPLLIMQGSEDPIVPPAQAEAIAEAVRSKGVRVEYRLFEGESHGWRKTKTIELAIEQELAFYKEVLGLGDEDDEEGLPEYSANALD
ncbi:alpha/beta-hydrolase [Daedalea quercina L-15889]|uniref:Alpha/beta-hydrolase n=1 Tax=Daedalea quercina L-15889 TaxID=1314783 RepID=A0A165RP70_9APHY|nr:alpha/beta-hydrolase [Daedalea quercina L-15889]